MGSVYFRLSKGQMIARTKSNLSQSSQPAMIDDNDNSDDSSIEPACTSSSWLPFAGCITGSVRSGSYVNRAVCDREDTGSDDDAEMLRDESTFVSCATDVPTS